MSTLKEIYASIQEMREIRQTEPENGMNVLHQAIKHLYLSPLPTSDAIQILADLYDLCYHERHPHPVPLDDDGLRNLESVYLDARSGA